MLFHAIGAGSVFRRICLVLIGMALAACRLPVEPIAELPATDTADLPSTLQPTVPTDAPARAATTSTADPPPPTPLPARSRLAFAQRTRGPGDPDLVIIDGQTRQGAQEIALPGLQTSPSWSPDGQALAFVGTMNSTDPNDCVSGYVEFRCNFDIYAVRADGSDLQRLTNDDTYDRDPSWSPDGARIAFSVRPTGNPHGWIAVMNADGSDVRTLTTGPVSDHTPTWSPDGQQIAFMRIIKDDIHIYRMEADGSGLTQLTTGTNVNAHPAWAPDGRDIAWITIHGDAASEFGVLSLMKPDGTAQRQIKLSHAVLPRFPPTWSPDSQWLVFVGLDEVGQQQLYQVKRDGSGLHAVTEGTATFTAPAWSPMFVPVTP